MSLLLLDPLVLLLYACVGVYGWAVWSGRFRSWFRPDRLWLGLWPLPAVVAVVPLAVGPLLRLVDGLGPRDESGGVLAVVTYVLVNGVPIAWLGFAPPRWLLPPWARRRLAPLPAADERPRPDAVPAAHASRAGAAVGWPRWRWRIDAEPGHLWVADGHLRFRATEATTGVEGIDEFDQADIDQLQLRWGAEARLEPPRGGWWRRRQLDVELRELDHWEVGVTRPWADQGLVTLEVTGRPVVRLWVARAGDVRTAIERVTADGG